ncbi:MAG: hypothetical protein KDD60_07855, partial [Bdellovibrionales bacterium]|nr:hypothetical protein [Bdellovibrionales bacterium]
MFVTRRACVQVFLFSLICLLVASPAFAKTSKKKFLKATAVQVLDGGAVCVQLKSGKWVAAKRKGKKYLRDKRKENMAACSEEITSGQRAASSLTQLPNLGDLLNSGSGAQSVVSLLAVAPTLDDLADAAEEFGGIAQYFFSESVLSSIQTGNPTSQQCDEYFEGILSCHIAESTGHTMEQILASGTSLCYMQNLPNATGGVRLVKGSGTVKTLFASATTAKLVKVKMVEMEDDFSDDEFEEGPDDEGDFEDEFQPNDIYIRVSSLSENQDSGDHYHATLVYCEPGEDGEDATLVGYEDIRVTADNELIVRSAQDEGPEQMNALITASLREIGDGNFEFDPTQSRI